MSESGYVELPILQWLSGQDSLKPDDTGLGWTYRDEEAMAAFDRPLEDPLVERLLVEAIIRINTEVTTETQAKMAMSALRKAMAHPDKLTANRETLELLRNGASLEIVPGQPAKTVQFIEFDPARQHLNDFTATNQYCVQGVKQCREDTVLLVNGIPLVIAEYKSYITSGKDWQEAVRQLHRYQRQAPLMLASNWRGTLVTTIQSFQRMNDLEPRQRDNIISLVDECHRTQKGDASESYAMTMRVKLPQAFRFGFTGTPIDKTMINTHRDFGPTKDGEQERYLSYYGIKRAIKDGATLEVHYLRDRVPFIVDEEKLNLGFEQMCADMELEDEEAKDFIQRRRSQWKELARHPDRIQIVLDKDARALSCAPRP